MINAKKPVPFQMKLLAGNPGKRPINTNVPTPSGKIGACPEWFPYEAEEEWNRIVPELEAMGLLSSVDSAVLQAHCLLYAEVVITAKNGQPLKATMMGQLRVYAAELGLTPSSRQRLASPGKKNDDPAEQFFAA